MPNVTDAQKGHLTNSRKPFKFLWAEYIGTSGASQQQYQFGHDSSQASWVIDAYWDGFATHNDIIPEILGYSYRRFVDGVPMIGRDLPVRHPHKPWLWATSVTNIHGIKPVGFQQGTQFGDAIEAYDRARMTINFGTLPYEVLSDQEIIQAPFNGDESKRFTQKLWKATVEHISVDRGFFRFAEGAVQNPKFRDFPLGSGRMTVKVDLEWTWFDIPEECLFNAAGFPTNILASLGTVNHAPIWGYPRGTLLMLPPELTPVMQPVHPRFMNKRDTEPPRAWNVKFLFKYWNPPLGPFAVERGHNTAMWVRDALFYLIRPITQARPFAFNGNLFEYSNFGNIFKSL